MDRIEEILEFWFEGVDDSTIIDKKVLPFRKWFSSSPQFDQDIQRQFGADLLKAAQGVYQDWEKTPHGRLALILLFDQFSRNIYRNTPQMYAFDSFALQLTLKTIQEKRDQELMLIERAFLYMPLMHSEDRRMQELSVQCFEQLVADARQQNPANVSYYEYHLTYAKKYLSIISQFGRFPHRNPILGR
ncbi:MAG: DUF924 domain-containing protein [Candidatus Omnitrophica bacterium]|nr:DUF924 domain-containing protein [Candidatus Omnitrophota bacterium]